MNAPVPIIDESIEETSMPTTEALHIAGLAVQEGRHDTAIRYYNVALANNGASGDERVKALLGKTKVLLKLAAIDSSQLSEIDISLTEARDIATAERQIGLLEQIEDLQVLYEAIT
jgi:hypothetical protein